MDNQPHQIQNTEAATLLTALFIGSICGLLYELLISSVSSYFFGSSVLHFSVTIGLFMFFMGIGSYLSQFFSKKLESFIKVEIVIGFLGGISAFVLFATNSLTEWYYLIAFLFIAAISIGIGLEIPLVTRILKSSSSVKKALAHTLTFDYLGALVASFLFPLLLLPYLGLTRTGFAIGLINLSMVVILIQVFRHRLSHPIKLLGVNLLLIITLGAGLVYTSPLTTFFESFRYQDEIIHQQQTPYQTIIVTQFRNDVRLFLDGNLQFSSIDEYRYHESLVHIPMNFVRHPEHIAILGGGDGLAIKELLKYEEVQNITLIDLDPAVTDLAKNHPTFRKLNQDSLHHSKVTVINQDAYQFMEESNELYSLIILDLPDPNNLSLGKLYSREFYHLLSKRLSADGMLVTQSTSPFFAQKPFWSIHHTLEEVFPSVLAYQTYVPSFGQWGFNLAGKHLLDQKNVSIPVQTQYLTPAVIKTLFVFDPDTQEIETDINQLDNQVLVQYYQESLDLWE